MTSKPTNIMTEDEEKDLERMIQQRHSAPRRGAFSFSNGSSSGGSGISGPHNKAKKVTSVDSPTRYVTNSRRRTLDDEPSSPVMNEKAGKEKNVVVKHSSRLIVGYADTIGKRPTMEDDMCIVGDLRGKEEDLIGVFDGHGSREVSNLAAQNLYTLLSNYLEKTEDPELSIRSTFYDLNTMVKDAGIQRAGSTALIAFFTKDAFYIGNAGDSRAVLCLEDKAVRLSVDHKPDDPIEEDRIVKAGGTVTRIVKQGKTIARVNGMLAVSRAIGDIALLPAVSPEPDVKRVPFDSSQKYLILACDGLWDVLSDDEARSIAIGSQDPEDAAIRLRDLALQKGSTDNISVVVIQLPPVGYSPPPSKNPPVEYSFNSSPPSKNPPILTSEIDPPTKPKSTQPQQSNSQKSSSSPNSHKPSSSPIPPSVWLVASVCLLMTFMYFGFFQIPNNGSQ